MKYREFVTWCDERACDGCWGFYKATICIDVIDNVQKLPFWKREKFWQKVNEQLGIIEFIVIPTNKKIEEYLKGE